VSLSQDLTLDGTSLLPCLQVGTQLPERDLFWQIDLYKSLQRHYPKPEPYATEAMVSGPWKLLTFEGRPVELFDIRRDPHELNNVLADHAERAEAMATRVRAWLAEPRSSWSDSQ
jgi:arylsulfatase A-like enzyme